MWLSGWSTCLACTKPWIRPQDHINGSPWCSSAITIPGRWQQKDQKFIDSLGSARTSKQTEKQRGFEPVGILPWDSFRLTRGRAPSSPQLPELSIMSVGDCCDTQGPAKVLPASCKRIRGAGNPAVLGLPNGPAAGVSHGCSRGSGTHQNTICSLISSTPCR